MRRVTRASKNLEKSNKKLG